MTDPDEARYLARASNLLATFRQIAQDEHPNVIAEAALAFLAESLANHPNRDEMVQHVLDQLRTIVDQIAEGEPGGRTRVPRNADFPHSGVINPPASAVSICPVETSLPSGSAASSR
jgi:hypothetical protein